MDDPFAPSTGQIHFNHPAPSLPATPQAGGGGGEHDRMAYMVEALSRKLDMVLAEVQRLRKDLGH